MRESVASALVLDAIEQCNEVLVDLAADTVSHVRGADHVYTRDDLRQMVEGLISVLREWLHDDEHSKRDFFLATVIPSVVQLDGTPMPLARTAARWVPLVAAHVTRHLPSGPDGDEATRLLATFLAGYIDDLLLRTVAAGT